METNNAADLIGASLDPDADIIFGTSFNEDLKDEVVITVVATGLAEIGTFSDKINNKVRASSNSSAPSVTPPSHDTSTEAAQNETPTEYKEVPVITEKPTSLDIPSFLRRG